MTMLCHLFDNCPKPLRPTSLKATTSDVFFMASATHDLFKTFQNYTMFDNSRHLNSNVCI